MHVHYPRAFFTILGLIVLLNAPLHGLAATHKNNPPDTLTLYSANPLDSTRISFKHLASFASTSAATAVDLRINGTISITNFQFGEEIDDLELAAGDYTIEVLAPGIGIVISQNTFTVESGQEYVVSIIGNGIVQPIVLSIHPKDLTVEPAQAKLRLLHYAAFAADIADSAVSLCTDQDTPLQENIQYNTFSDPYLLLEPGIFDLKIVAGTNGCAGDSLHDLEPLVLAKESITELYFFGEPINQPFDTIRVDSSPEATPTPTQTSTPTTTPTSTATPLDTPTPIITTTATITVTPAITPTATPVLTTTPVATPNPSRFGTLSIANFAPFANNLLDTNINVHFTGAADLADFEISELTFGNVIGNVPIEAGSYQIEFIPTGTNVVALNGEITIPAGAHHMLALIGNGSVQPLDLYFEEQNSQVLNDTKAVVNVVNFAPLDRELPNTAIDVCTVNGNLLHQGLQYTSTVSPTLMLDPQTYYVQFTKSGTDCGEIVTEIPRLQITTNRYTRIFIIGDSRNQPLASVNLSTQPVVYMPQATPTSPPNGTESNAHYLAAIMNGANTTDNDEIEPPLLSSDGITTTSGLRIIEIREGDGVFPQSGQFVEVDYIGWLDDGTQIRNTYQAGEPAKFQIGVGNLIVGWEEGVQLMRVGGKSRLIIPPELGYGDTEVAGIPVGSTLIYDIELRNATDTTGR